MGHSLNKSNYFIDLNFLFHFLLFNAKNKINHNKACTYKSSNFILYVYINTRNLNSSELYRKKRQIYQHTVPYHADYILDDFTIKIDQYIYIYNIRTITMSINNHKNKK